MTQITITMSSPDEALRGLDARTHRKVWIRSANKTMAKAKTIASREIRAEYFIKAATSPSWYEYFLSDNLIPVVDRFLYGDPCY